MSRTRSPNKPGMTRAAKLLGITIILSLVSVTGYRISAASYRYKAKAMLVSGFSRAHDGRLPLTMDDLSKWAATQHQMEVYVRACETCYIEIQSRQGELTWSLKSPGWFPDSMQRKITIDDLQTALP